jgi:hypothetical protein
MVPRLCRYYNDGPEGSKKDIALLFPKFFAQRPDWKIIVVSGTADAGACVRACVRARVRTNGTYVSACVRSFVRA